MKQVATAPGCTNEDTRLLPDDAIRGYKLVSMHA